MEVSPNLLEFKGSFTKPNTEYLSLTNTSSSPLAFKVKTTAPKLYCVRPNASVVEPGTTVKISIILQGFSRPLPADFKCKDKFLIVSLPCPDIEDASKVGDIWSSLESKYKEQLVSKKLRVNYVINESEDSEINDSNIGNSSTDASADASTAAGIAAASKIDKSQPADELQKELDASNAKINNLSQKLDSNESSPKSEVATEEPVSGFSIPFAILLVLVAFLFGWLIF